ncbi:MAG TPA: class I SAM-dependent methyltransferase [Xanthobacteraceae bacterium]
MAYSVETAPASGLPAVDRYLADGYLDVRGMSSRFAAAIVGATMRIQSENGIGGHAAEIGTFEGRFFIALAHALQPSERAIGIDHFEWPNAGVIDRFKENLARHGPKDERAIVLKADSRTLRPEELLGNARGKRIRFFHIDGEHTPDHLSKDLALAHATLDPKGVICLDDMLHPGYPILALTVDAYLRKHPEMRVFCVIDREDIVAAAKYMICREEHVAFYADALTRTFAAHVWPLGADFGAYHALVLAPEPRLADIG